jgi:hypothetical protein
MKVAFLNKKDFWAGMMFLGTGAAAVFISRNYRFGTMLRMGPGYFPTLLGWILILFGIYIMVRGLRSNEKIKGSWSVRVLIMLPLSLVLFGILMVYAGFIPALAALVFVSAASGKEFKFVEALLVTVFLVMLSVAVFIWGLGLPYPLINNF